MPETKARTERGIIMQAESIRKILRGEKTQTRRVINPQPPSDAKFAHDHDGVVWHKSDGEWVRFDDECPYGTPGDVLYPLVPIPNVREVYAASTDGVIYSKARGSWRPLKSWSGSKYDKVTIMREDRGKTTRSVHSLVCAAFHGPRPSEGHQVRHLDGDARNNMPWNLKWGTQKDNWRDRKAHGNGTSGENHHAAKFSDTERAHIRWAVENDLCSQRHAARALGVSQRAIYGIVHGDGEEPPPEPEPSMPEWTGRLRLRVEDVRVERVQEISADDCIAEGISVDYKGDTYPCRDVFACLWDQINLDRGYPWEDNPWVWCLKFSRLD